MKSPLVILLTILSLSAFPQSITNLSLTASGLTCSMCNKAIYKSLVRLSSVQKVDADIQAAAFTIYLKPGSKVVLDDFKKAVQDAGFSVAALRIKANFTQSSISSGTELLLEGNRLSFPGVDEQVLVGARTLLLIDKGYLSEKDRLKYDHLLQGSSGGDVKPTRFNGINEAPGANVSRGVEGNVYHVVLQQS